MCPVYECHGYDARPDIALPKYRLCHQLRSVPGDLCRSGHGFTLVEVLVVLLILGVIATIVMLSLAGFLGNGKTNTESAPAVDTNFLVRVLGAKRVLTLTTLATRVEP